MARTGTKGSPRTGTIDRRHEPALMYTFVPALSQTGTNVCFTFDPFSTSVSERRRIPEFCLGFPGAFHRIVLSYYGRQVSEVCYVTATYGVEDSLVRAIFAKE